VTKRKKSFCNIPPPEVSTFFLDKSEYRSRRVGGFKDVSTLKNISEGFIIFLKKAWAFPGLLLFINGKQSTVNKSLDGSMYPG
jgi:hypothetical protein